MNTASQRCGAAKVYKDMTGLSCIEGGLLHMCITNIRQRNLSTNKGYRATFTKAQIGKDLGTEAGQYGSFYRFPYTHNALTAKNAFIWSVHTPGGGTVAHHRGGANPL